MKVTPAQDAYFHKRLPIDKNEVVIAVYKHHPIAYIIPLLLALLMITVIVGLAFALTSSPAGTTAIITPAYRSYAMAGVAIFSFLILLFSYIPVWTKMQDQFVLTNESLVQLLQTNLFSNKVSQLSLQDVTDVTVRAGFWGNLLSFGHLTIETPGEQDNYEYRYLPTPNVAAREISEAHENFIEALNSGQLIPESPIFGNSGGRRRMVSIDPAEYEKYQDFLRYQQQNAAPQDQPPQPPAQS